VAHCLIRDPRLQCGVRKCNPSPQFLWITRGTPIWGRDAALKRFEALYQGTCSFDPKIDELRVTELQPGVVQLYVP
jgi:hypothetical protein